MGTTLLEKSETRKAAQFNVRDVVTNRTWQVCAAVAAVALVVIYRLTLRWEWSAWTGAESEYSHGPLIPFMAAFLIWYNRNKIAKITARPSLWGLVVLIPALFLQFAAHRSAAFSVGGMTIPIVLIGVSLLLLGKEATKEMIFPLLFVFFMCVPPNSILTRVSHEIQMESTRIATGLLKMMGYSAVREGITIHLPSITVQVAAACSGIRTLVLMLAYSSFLAYMLVGPLWGRLSLVALVVPLAVITNSIRVLVVSLSGEYYGQDVMHQVHDYGGYVIVFISMIALFYIARVVKCRDFRSMPTS